MIGVDGGLATTARGFSEEALKEISRSRGEPEWLRERRLEAWRSYEAMPMPSRREEEWRRTDLSELDLAGDWGVPGNPPYPDPVDMPSGMSAPPARGEMEERPVGAHGRAPLPEDLPKELRAELKGGERDGGLLVHRNSVSVYRHLPGNLAARGVILADLDSAAREYPELVARHLMAQTSPDGGKFAALHAAFWSGGTFLYVPRGVEVEVPIHSLSWLDAAGLAVMPHTLIVAEAGSSVVLVDEFGSVGATHASHLRVGPEGLPGGPSPRPSPKGRGGVETPSLAGRGSNGAGSGVSPVTLANRAVELVLGEGARVSYVGLQRWGGSVFSFATQRASVGRDAHLTSLSVVLGGRLTKSWVESTLREPGASVQMVGIMFGSGNERFHHHTLQDHQAPNTTSDLLFKVALAGRSRSEYSGLIRVHKGAQRSDAYQANRNLLLSSHARADSMPKLEIENNDVRCTHGATVGPIDEEQIFYLMARGLPRTTAERMIVEGFFEPAMGRIPLPGVRERVRRAVDAKLAAVR